MKYKVKWANVEMTFDSDTRRIHAEEPKLGIGSRRYDFAASQVTAVTFGLGRLATNCVGIEWQGSHVFMVPAPFKRDYDRGIAFVHAVGKAAGLRQMSSSEAAPLLLAYTRKQPAVAPTAVTSRAVSLDVVGDLETKRNSSAVIPPAVEGWWPDPFGRHELRYGLDSGWTDYVSDQGIQSCDPTPA